MTIGFIGLGNLGTAIATRLSSLDIDILAYNRTKKESCSFKQANSPKEILESCNTVFLCLFDSVAVDNILQMPDGLLNCDLKGKTIIDLTTNHYENVLEFHKKIEEKNGNYLEVPVFGSVIPALNGLVTVVASGKEDIFNKSKPLLEKFAKEIFFLEEPSSASKMKLINNLCLGSFMATIAECTALGEACDINKTTLLEILSVGGGQSLVLNAKKQKLIDEDFTPHFSNDAINKDLHTLQDLAYTLKRPLYTATAPKELFSKMKMLGKGKEDFSSIYSLFKE